MAMAWIALTALVLHTVFSWLLMLKLGWGLMGAAVVLNSSWWFIVVAELVYILSGTYGEAWTGFFFQAFQNLWGFVRLLLASAVILCLKVCSLDIQRMQKFQSMLCLYDSCLCNILLQFAPLTPSYHLILLQPVIRLCRDPRWGRCYEVIVKIIK